MTRIITITSGKGGVGKTNISVNLSLHLARMGYSVCLFDADFGLANVNLLLKLYPEHNLKDVILNDMELSEIIIRNFQGIDIIPGSSGVEEMANLKPEQIARLINAFSKIDTYDYFIIDTAAGISRDVISFCLASSEILLVITPDPTSITDAYALLKILALNGYKDPVMVTVNQSPNMSKAKTALSKLAITVKKFLSLKLLPVGVIGRDSAVTEAVEAQKPFLSLSPHSQASKSIKKLTENIINKNSGQIELFTIGSFWEKCLNIFKSPLKTIHKKKDDAEGVPGTSIEKPPPPPLFTPPATIGLSQGTSAPVTVSEHHEMEDVKYAEKLIHETNTMLSKVVESIACVTSELKSIRGLIEEGREMAFKNTSTEMPKLHEDTVPSSLMVDRLTELMSAYAMFQSLEDHEIRDIVSRLKLHKFNTGDIVIKKGDPGQNLFIIISGKADVIDDHGIVLDSMKEEDVFGEMSLISGDPVNATIKVIETAQVLYLNGKDFIHVLHTYPPLQMYFARLLSKRLSGRLEKANMAKEQYLESGLTGKLAETSAPELLQMLNTGQKTGLLTFHLSKGIATITFNHGRLVDARYDDHEGQDAFFEILKDAGEGRFSYSSEIPEEHMRKPEIGHFMRMLIEGLSRIDEERP
ncbi:MAG: AAA family ATPase [Proteobacteria bacterium]|nr:AAA family ATPase [Pseudomonadota bacterium]